MNRKTDVRGEEITISERMDNIEKSIFRLKEENQRLQNGVNRISEMQSLRNLTMIICGTLIMLYGVIK